MEIWIGGLLALAGTLLGSLTAFFGPIAVARHTHKVEMARERYARREELLAEFIDTFLESAEYTVPYSAPAAQHAGARMRRAQMQLQLLLSKDEVRAEEYIMGLVRAVASVPEDTNARRSAVEHGGQELIEWHKGVSVPLRPFRPVGYGPAGTILVEFLDEWP